MHRRDCRASSLWGIQNERQRYQGRWRRLSSELPCPARGDRKHYSTRLRAGTDAGIPRRISLAKTKLRLKANSYGRPLLSNFTTVTTIYSTGHAEVRTINPNTASPLPVLARLRAGIGALNC